MKILNLFTVIIMNLVMVMPLQAQIGKEMKAFRNKEGITVIMLTPSLYSLYKKNNLSTSTEKVLNNLQEINLLRADLNLVKTSTIENLKQKLNAILENESKYNLVKSHDGALEKERMFTSQNNNHISSFILWNEKKDYITIIELKGDIVLQNIYLLGDVLNLEGMELLSYISGSAQENDSFMNINQDDFQKFMNEFHQGISSSEDSSRFNQFHKSHNDRLNDMFFRMQEMLLNMEDPFEHMQGMGRLGESMSNGLEVIQENGKTRIKVNSKNTEIIYLIDGKEFTTDSIKQIPDEIATVNMVQSPDDPKKSYVVINTKQKAGKFISYSNGILKFNYDKQDYTFNLDKIDEPILVINNLLTRNFDIDPADIIQIRPVTEIERKILGYPSAKITIVIDKMMFGF